MGVKNINKQQRKRFKQLKLKNKENTLNIDEIDELISLYRISAERWDKICRYSETALIIVAFLSFILTIIMTMIVRL